MLDARHMQWFRGTVARRARDKTTMALMIGAVLVWIVAGYFALNQSKESEPEPTPTAAADATPSAPQPTVSASTAAAAPAPSSAPRQSLIECVTAVFPPGSLGDKADPKFEFICTENNPLRGGTKMRSRLVLMAGRGLVTDAMRLWASLGWYEMANYTLIRTRCCEKIEPVQFHFDLACPIDVAIGEWEKKVKTEDFDTIDGAVEDYHKAVRCLSQFGQSTNFGRSGPPGAGVAGLKRVIKRVYGGGD
jgi:hypothetical protein